MRETTVSREAALIRVDDHLMVEIAIRLPLIYYEVEACLRNARSAWERAAKTIGDAGIQLLRTVTCQELER